MNELKIEIGDTVKIAKSSEFYNCPDANNPQCEGVYIAISEDYFYTHHVEWVNGHANYYRLRDLTLIKKGKKDMKEFTKSDLKTGMFVKQRDGMFMLVLEKAAVGSTCFTNLADLNESLLSGYTHLDIVAVYQAVHGGIVGEYMRGESLTLIWRRTEQTEAQKEMASLQVKMSEMQEQVNALQGVIDNE